MKTTKTLLITILFILNLSVAFASNNYNFNLYNSNNAPITSVSGLFYACQVSGCADNVEPNRFSTKNSGSSNLISQNYLGTSSPQDYLSVFLSQCYLPVAGVTSGDWGTGQTYDYNVQMSKASNCHSPIYSYTVLNSVHVNEPLQVDVLATLDANTASAFRRTGFPPLFTPSGYETYFSANTQITLEILNSAGQIVNTQTENVDIPVDTQIPVHFVWTPTIAGDYTAKITTDVTDCQCESGTQEHVSSAFTVLQDAPIIECYTIVNNLESSNYFPFVDQTVTLSIDKTSNYADNMGTLSPVATRLTWTITNLNTSEVSTFTTNHNSNPNALNPIKETATFTPNKAGQYLINVNGIANDNALCTSTNTQMSTQMTMTVLENPTICTDVDGDGFSQEGGICGLRDCADTNLNIHPGAAEICNSVDDNCNGQIDEIFGINSACNVGVGACLRTGVTVCTPNGQSTQCSIVAGTPVAETCNNIDDNCNGVVDESLTQNAGLLGACSVNTQTCASGVWVNNNQISPTTEVCNNLDDNCNGVIDEGLAVVCSSNANCNDNNVLTLDVCNNAGTCGSSCSNTAFVCSSNADCNDNNILTLDVCNNPGTLASSCTNTAVACVLGQSQDQSCGVSSVGACTLGVQTSNCLANNTWGTYGVCVGNTDPITETCNNVDDNCDGTVDESLIQNAGLLGACSVNTQTCASGVWVNNNQVSPSAETCNNVDDNCNGVVDESLTQNAGLLGACSVNTQTCASGVWVNNNQISPTTEVCNGLDDNCNGVVDEGGVCPVISCIDSDNDGFNSTGGACGVVDCNDNNMMIHPGMIEVCNAVDDNCNGVIDEGLAVVCSSNANCNDNNVLTLDVCNNAGTCGSSCSNTAFVCSSNADCNDNVVLTLDVCNNPGTLASSCSNIAVACVLGQSQDQSCGVSSVGACTLGVQTSNCLANNTWGTFGVCVGNINPIAETCNNLDDNCNGVVDESLTQNAGLLGACSVNTQTCASGVWVNNNQISPIAETCNNLDDNCNGVVDESLTQNAGLLGACSVNTQTCASGVWVNNNQISPIAEICNNLDDNCNGVVDEGSVCNMPPVAIAGLDKNAVTNQIITLNGNASYDPDGNITNYFWQISDGRTFNGVLQSLSFAALGLYNANLTVTDNNGANASDLLTINISMPIALNIGILANPNTGIPPLKVYFTANIISGNPPYTFYWDFGDGYTSTEQNPVHIFYDEKIFFITLRVTDAIGNILSATTSVNTNQDHSIKSREAIFITNFDVISDKICSGDTLEINTGFKNIGGKRLSDATITISIPELGISSNAKFGRMNNGDSIDKIFYLKLPTFAKEGYHNIRLSFSANSGQVKRTEYRQIAIKCTGANTAQINCNSISRCQ